MMLETNDLIAAGARAFCRARSEEMLGRPELGCTTTCEHCAAAMTAALATIQSLGVIMAPSKPTAEMLDAASDARAEAARYGDSATSTDHWKAMISHTPFVIKR